MSNIIAFSAAFIALCALFATIGQTYLALRHNKLSVRPHVDFRVYASPSGPVKLSVINHGLGPAIVDTLKVIIGDDEFSTDMNGVMPKEFAERIVTSQHIEWITLGPNTPIKAEGVVDLFTFPDSHTDASLQRHNDAIGFLKNVRFELTYRSMYREKFKLIYPVQKQ